MNTYQFLADSLPPNDIVCVRRGDGASIPLDPDNSDYVQFLEDWKNGAEVLNHDGTPAPYVAPETP